MEGESGEPYVQPDRQQNIPAPPRYISPGGGERRFVRAIQMGIMLVILGVIISVCAQGFGGRGTTTYYDVLPSYEDWVGQVVTVGEVIYYVGLAVLLLGLISLALLAKEMHIHMRIALVIAFALVFGSGIWGGALFSMSPFL